MSFRFGFEGGEEIGDEKVDGVDGSGHVEGAGFDGFAGAG